MLLERLRFFSKSGFSRISLASTKFTDEPDSIVIGKAISFLKVLEDESVNIVLEELKASERYQNETWFKKNVDDDVSPDYWWMI